MHDHHSPDAPKDGRALFGPVRYALATALDSLTVADADLAAVALAHSYAHAIDTDGDLAKLGPPFLAALVQLGMTPAARKTLTGGGATDAPTNPLDLLAAKRAARGR